MANFPTSIDVFVDPAPTGPPRRAEDMGLAFDAITAVETKVGINNSTDPTSLDYKISHGGAGAAWQTYVPVITQSNTPTFTTTYAKYVQNNKLVVCEVYLVLTGTGTASNKVTVSLPVNLADSNPRELGVGRWFNSVSGNLWAIILPDSASTIQFNYTQQSTGLGMGLAGTVRASALAATDSLSFAITYESV